MLAGGVLLLGLALAQSAPPAVSQFERSKLERSGPSLLFAQQDAPDDPAAPAPDSPAPGDAAPADAAPDPNSADPSGADPANPDQNSPDPNSADPASSDQTDPNAPADPAQDGAQEGASVQLTRKTDKGEERIIKIVRTGLTDDTGIFASCAPNEDEPPGSPTISVFSETGPGGIQVTVDKNLIRAPLALVTQQENGDGHIEMSAGTAQFLDAAPEGKTDRLSRCEVEATPKPAPDTVFVTQGRTDLKGKTLVYDETDGIARIAGPITFSRKPDAGKSASDALNGTSERIEVDVDNETTTLAGKVVLKNGTRTSTAGRVDYDDAANVAILRGGANGVAESVDGKDVIRAPVLRYNLDLNTVVAIRSKETPITGEFDDGDTSTAPASPLLPGSAAPAPNQPAPPISPDPNTPDPNNTDPNNTDQTNPDSNNTDPNNTGLSVPPGQVAPGGGTVDPNLPETP